MSITIDLNADIGEATTTDGVSSEREILRYVSTVSIACGGHTGDVQSMTHMTRVAKGAGVKIGAHPSYPDRENFGRKSLALDVDIDAAALRKNFMQQVQALIDIADAQGHPISHVKPHGALYTDAAKDTQLANLIAQCIFDCGPHLIFVGAPNGAHKPAAMRAGLRFVSEGFIDRAYGANGQIMPRNIEGALITDPDARLRQAQSLALHQTVILRDKSAVNVPAQTLCLHGDSAGAVQMAQSVRERLEVNGVSIASFAS